VDGEAGGSWIAVNELGVSLCVLNAYEVAGPDVPAGGGAFRSRGLLVTDLAGAGAAEQAARSLAATDLESYRPFTLLALDAAGGERAFRWDGRALADLGPKPPMPLVSSGHDVAGAALARGRLLAGMQAAAGGLSPDLLLRFHRSHEPERGPYSPCMHRSDAETVSLSWVRVSPQAVAFAYAPGPPCTTPLGEPLEMARAAS
jgi:hypothetical protein